MDIAKNREGFWKDEVRAYFYENNPRTGTYRKRFIADIVKQNNITSVLELGCSSGGNLMTIHKSCPDVKITGFDICEDAIKHAKEVEGNPAEFVIGSLYDLSGFDDNSFDLVFTSSVLFHIPTDKVKGIIAEQMRIAKRFIFNIERHGKKESVFIERQGIPHQWVTNYIKIYQELGLKPKTDDMAKKFAGKKIGGATHIISAGLDGNELRYA